MALATLSIDLEAKVAKFTSDLGQAARVSEKTASRISGALNGIKAAAGGLVAGLSVGLLAGQVQEVASYADELGKLSQRTGVAVEALSGLTFAAKLSDVSNEQLGGGLQRLSKYLQEAAGGVESNRRALKELGVTELSDTNKAFLQLAKRFSEMKEGAGKTAAVMEIFGKSGADLLPLLNTGAAGIKAATDEAERFGLIVGKDAVIAAERFNDNLTRLQALVGGARVSLFSDLVVGLGAATEAYLKASAAGSKFEGVLAAIQTTLTGDDRHKNNVTLTEQTEELLKLEKEIAQLRSGGSALDAAAARKKEERLKVLQREIATTLTYRKALEAEQAQPAKTGDVDAKIFGTGTKAKVVKTPALADNTQRALDQYIEQLQKAIEKEQDLTEVQKAQLRIAETGARGFSEFKRQYVLSLAKQVDDTRRLKDEEEALSVIDQQLARDEQALAEIRVRAASATDQRLASIFAENTALVQSNKVLSDQLQELGLTAEALNRLQIARLDEALAAERQNLVNAQNIEDNETEIALIEKRIRLKEIERGLVSTTADRKREITQQEEDKKRTDTLAKSIEDGILTGFRDGGRAADVFIDELKAQFAKTVLRPLIQPIAEAGNRIITAGLSAIATAFGLPSFAGGGYTGSGARVGGLDGYGGSLAMVHPRETVVDHTRGQSAGGTTIIQQQWNVGDVASMKTVRKAIAHSQRASAVALSRSQNYGGAFS